MRASGISTVGAIVVAAALCLASPTPSPHEGHQGYHKPGAEFDTTVIPSNSSSTSVAAHTHSHAASQESSHSHSHSGTPLITLNETQVLQGHAPDPLSYLEFDLYGLRQGYKSGWGDDAFDTAMYSDTLESHGWWMIWHIVLMTGAFFGALPAAIALRSSDHALQPVAHTAFVVMSSLGWIAGGAYKKQTPNLYAGSSHSWLGSFLILAAVALFVVERIGSARRFFTYVQSFSERRGGKLQWGEVWLGVTVEGEDEKDILIADETGADARDVVFDTGAGEESPWANDETPSPGSSSSHDPVTTARKKYSPQFSTDFAASTLHDSPAGGRTTFSYFSRSSAHDEIYHLPETSSYKDQGTVRSWAGSALFVLERLFVVLAYVASISGTAVYLGGCRDAYLNGCLAHLIKGSNFFLYGLVTFARYLGAWADLGWAWNTWVPPPSVSATSSTHPSGSPRSILISETRSHPARGEWSPVNVSDTVESPRTISPSLDRLGFSARGGAVKGKRTRRPPTPELIESAASLVYGATGTFMERFGAESGSPYTAKQIQHISIAVMYFLAGCLGVALELGWLSRPNTNKAAASQQQRFSPSYNLFPVLCVGITGIVMAMHHQTYVFQVQIHVLWGMLLALYTAARCATYVLMWVRSSDTSSSFPMDEGGATEDKAPPSPPPTEALAAFFLTGGGIAFIASTEQIGFWAMRSQRDDVMMFANLIVALVFLSFTWVFGVMAVKTWAERHRSATRLLSLSSPSTVVREPRPERASFDEYVEGAERYRKESHRGRE